MAARYAPRRKQSRLLAFFVRGKSRDAKKLFGFILERFLSTFRLRSHPTCNAPKEEQKADHQNHSEPPAFRLEESHITFRCRAAQALQNSLPHLGVSFHIG